ncbi:Protoheme IX farnesyltransferase [Candidatus Johnevansia muelleri]|uniref:Protoheme IX farnesyltransferase n=1 Tax=Candidatus Johnevansia muelleri TaxID=1495769 RepID=A0A078KHS5_9GAMM|nr:Protoheme IX farnesyltransferase [Candidatus Evansia muelleri]
MFKQIFLLIKPGIILGNLISVSCGFFLASKGSIDKKLFFYTILGSALIIASGCVLNNYIDQDIDRKMVRTHKRMLAKRSIYENYVIIYGCILGILSICILYIFTNILSLSFALIGYIIYVILYSIYFKRCSVYGTILGGVAGAIPPLIGYCAVINKVNIEAIILFMIFFVWQIPHFYAIAIFRITDYISASIPVLPVKKGISNTKNNILIYVLIFTITDLLLSIMGYTGYIYFIISIIMGIYWIYLNLLGYKHCISYWSKKMFNFSIIIIIVLSLIMSIDYQL